MLEDGTIRMAQAVDAAGSPLDVAQSEYPSFVTTLPKC